MKTKASKSPEETEVTPNRKKLKQARLPFKLISDVSPTRPSRKRKLTSPVTETASKLGKLSKENGVTDELIILCDDDSKDEEQPQTEQKILNPYVKLVDTVLKKKLQKSPKQKHSKKNKSHRSHKEESTASGDDKRTDDVELMDVDMPDDSKEKDKGNDSDNENDRGKKNDQNSVSDVIVLEDSNNPSDIKSPETDNVKDPYVSKTSDRVESPEINKGVTTPKRSARIKANVDEQNSLNSSSAQLDESNSNLTTPKRNKNSPTDNLDESLNETTIESNNMTPKQLQKKIDSAKKKEEREKERLDREKKRQQEKDDRAKQKQEKEEQRKKEKLEKEEIKRKEREEKEELRRKEKEEKDRQKELEKKLREEKEEQKRKEREEKEEQKRKEKEAREEERRKKQEAIELEKQEQELKKKKAAEAFVNFFVPKQKVESDVPNKGLVSKNSMLSSFTVKADMRLAPLVRAELTEENKNNLDSNIESQELSENDLYLKSLKRGTIIPISSGRTWPLSDKDDDIMIVEDELPPIDSTAEIMTCETVAREKLKPKLLSFHENRRPPYWGTWRKKSECVKARKPFGQEKQLDYEVDSDEEWEEEQEGESIDGSAAGSDDEQELDEYEVDNEVFVPHGYLSDEEATMDEDDVLSLSPETQKAKLKQLEDEFELELKKPTEKLKPRLYGLLWETNEGGKPDNCVDALWNYFGKLSMIMNDPTPHLQPSNNIEETEKKKKQTKKKRVVGEEDSKSPKVEKKKKGKSEEGVKKKEKKMPQQQESNKTITEVKNTQPAINSFLAKLKSQE